MLNGQQKKYKNIREQSEINGKRKGENRYPFVDRVDIKGYWFSKRGRQIYAGVYNCRYCKRKAIFPVGAYHIKFQHYYDRTQYILDRRYDRSQPYYELKIGNIYMINFASVKDIIGVVKHQQSKDHYSYRLDLACRRYIDALVYINDDGKKKQYYQCHIIGNEEIYQHLRFPFK